MDTPHTPTQSSPANPFRRGFVSFRIERTVRIQYEEGCAPIHRTLHRDSQSLSDKDITDSIQCFFNDDEVAIGDHDNDFVDTWSEGKVLEVLFSVFGRKADDSEHFIGDYNLRHSAQCVIENLTFEPGLYSPCWEISTTHLTEKGVHFLKQLAGNERESGMYFQAFDLPDRAVGLKLIATPWTDDSLMHDGTNVELLHQEMFDKGVPVELINIMFLAAQAKTRILIFDGDADVIDHLPTFDW